MATWLESGCAGIVQTEEQELGVLIEETQRGQDIVNYRTRREISDLALLFLNFDGNMARVWLRWVAPQIRVLGYSTGARLTFNMCSSVVLPALSRPRNRSLACLLRRPSEARIS
jgi:hypothetical protein